MELIPVRVLAHQRIRGSDLEQLQENLILDHAVGSVTKVPSDIVRLMLLLKAQGLALGYLAPALNSSIT